MIETVAAATAAALINLHGWQEASSHSVCSGSVLRISRECNVVVSGNPTNVTEYTFFFLPSQCVEDESRATKFRKTTFFF